MPNHIQTRELKDFEESTGTVSAEFSFLQDIIPNGKQFVVCVYGYDNGGEILDVAECKIGENHPPPQPEVIEFPRNP